MTNYTKSQAGITLVEILIGIVLSLMLSLAMSQIFITNKSTYKTQAGISRIQENARYAMQRISETINAGGFVGCLPGRLYTTAAATPPVIDNAGTFSPMSGTNAFGIRRAVPLPGVVNRSMITPSDDVGVSNITGLGDGTTVMISDCDKASQFVIKTVAESPAGSPPSYALEHEDPLVDPADPGVKAVYGNQYNALARIYLWTSSFFYIDTSIAGKNDSIDRPCKIADDPTTGYDDRSYCALYLNGDELMEGVHGLAVTYGIDADGDFLAEQYVSSIGTNNVMSIRVALTINSVDRLPDRDLLVKQVSSTFNLRNGSLN
ncbi:MAG: hypothetical protein GY703_20075 [Gammaproteobacteria bacterium]|nr:hypothetical protein [Gammaproteobacteria bacterium]